MLSEEVDDGGAATWSPDGRWVVTGGSVAGVQGLYKIPVHGGTAERIADALRVDQHDVTHRFESVRIFVLVSFRKLSLPHEEP